MGSDTQIGPFRPRDEAEIADFLAARSTSASPVLVRGGGTKAALGRPADNNAAVLDLGLLTGITHYEPAELVLTARAGTPLVDIVAGVAEHRQYLAFEPPDLAHLLGDGSLQATLGGTVATGFSGPRRIKAGAVRDHMLGARAVGGDGKIFKSGGRVVKNVTGFDVPKLLAASHGTLAVMTEITIKVLPAPETTHTLLIAGLDDTTAMRTLSQALGGPHEISGAADLPAAAARRSEIATVAAAGLSVTLLRLEGFGPSVTDRLIGLKARFHTCGPLSELDAEDSIRLWGELRDIAPLIDVDRIVWRLSLLPTDAARTVAAIATDVSVEAVYDWGGGLVWLALPPSDDAHAPLVRGALSSGHATLIRAPAAVRAAVPVFHPQPAALAALTRRVKAAFDPFGILGIRHMYPDL